MVKRKPREVNGVSYSASQVIEAMEAGEIKEVKADTKESGGWEGCERDEEEGDKRERRITGLQRGHGAGRGGEESEIEGWSCKPPGWFIDVTAGSALCEWQRRGRERGTKTRWKESHKKKRAHVSLSEETTRRENDVRVTRRRWKVYLSLVSKQSSRLYVCVFVCGRLLCKRSNNRSVLMSVYT